MKELRLDWEPVNITPLKDIEERIRYYFKGREGGVTLMKNGALIFTPAGRDYMADARVVMQEAKFLIDFSVVEMKLGGYMVQFHHTTSVFVGEEEYKNMRNEIIRRQAELLFPGEVFINNNVINEEHFLIGLYARGKLQYDAYHFSFYRRVGGV